MYGGSEAAAAGLHLSMGSLLEEQQRAPQMVSNLPNATPSSFYSGCESTYVVSGLRDKAAMFRWIMCWEVLFAFILWTIRLNLWTNIHKT